MAGLAVQNFVSAAVGIAVLAAVIRGFARRGAAELGNFWRDLTRTLLYVLLPISLRRRADPRLPGRDPDPRRLDDVHDDRRRRADARARPGRLAGGRSSSSAPTAAASSTSTPPIPFENPTALSNFVEMLLILLIPAALTATFGRMVGSRRQGWAIYAAMLVMFVGRDRVVYAAEQNGSPAQQAIAGAGHRRASRTARPAATWRARSSASASRQSSLGPRSRRSPRAARSTRRWTPNRARRARPDGQHDDRRGHLRRRRLGPLRDAAVRPAGGLHRRADGRPHAGVPRQEDRGARGEAGPGRHARGAADRADREPAIAIASKYGDPSIYNPGPQGFCESLYAYTSQANNNGSAFAGYTGFVQPNAPGNVGAYGISFADLLGGLAMLFGRFLPLLAALGVAGSLAGKRVSPPGPAPCAPTRRPSWCC